MEGCVWQSLNKNEAVKNNTIPDSKKDSPVILRFDIEKY